MSDQLRPSRSHSLHALRHRAPLIIAACVLEFVVLWHVRWLAPVIFRSIYVFLDVHLAGGALTGS
jgi:hypothetical protein